MLIVPTSRIILLKNPIEIDYANELTFNSIEEQFNYFSNLPKLECENATYQRKDMAIRFPTDPTLEGITFDDLIQYNYCMYQNDKWSDKWFYAFIKKVTFDNPGLSLIEIETDVWQTWMFDITFKNSFIEREHVNNDTIGLHTIPEGLETGDYVCNDITSLYSAGNTTYICVATSEVPSELGTNVYNRQYNGIYSGVSYVVFETPLAASNFIRALDGLGKAEAITSVFLIPVNLTGTLTFNTYDIHTTGDKYITTQAAFPPYSSSFVDLGTVSSITSPTSLNGYIPKNGKVYCYPFNYFYVTNNSGMDIEYHYEDFINNTASFKTIGAITPGCSIKCYPLNYKKLSDSNSMNSYNYGISAAKYPICSWSSDVYTNWLTQNGVNILGHTLDAKTAGIVKGVAQIGVGYGMAQAGDFITGGAMMGNGIRNIYDTMQENYRHSLIPDSARGNTNSGDITFSAGRMDIPLYKMSIRREYAECIDNYFQMFGYKVNTLKIPNITGRRNWNFVKTISCNIIGNIPQEDMQKIKEIFNSGVTLWHNPSTFLDYSQSNPIV